MRILRQLLRCLIGRHKPVGFTDGARTLVICEVCLKTLKRSGI